ncbi:MAG: sulfatase [Solirubrobacterales bacterium]
MRIRALAALAAMLAAALTVAPGRQAHAVTTQPRPNVVVIETDDQTVSELTRATMPSTLAALADQGTQFTDSVVSAPLCCPSRAGFLTGQYPHNDGVYDNTPGYPALIAKDHTLFTDLQANGYRTGIVGRFLLNYTVAPPPGADYPDSLGGALAPPGVDDWFGYIESAAIYYNALFSDNGIKYRAGVDPTTGYTTNVINREAVDFVADHAQSAQPFFLWVTQVAPHTSDSPQTDACGGGTPIPESSSYPPFAAAPLPRPPSFNEKRISDKPHWVRARRRIQPDRLELLRRGWRCALASLTSVDRGVSQVIAELTATGELDNTAIFFTSDNGLLFGEHRLVQDKSYPYEEALRVPLLARVPRAYLALPPDAGPPRTIDAPVTQLDLAATILDLTSTAPCTSGGCRGVDGRSLLPLLERAHDAWPKRRATLIEIGNPSCTRNPATRNGLTNFYAGIRTPRFIYLKLHHVNPATGLCDRTEYELYDLKRDPYELDNIAVNPEFRHPSDVQRGLAARLRSLRSCAGIADRDPQVPGRPYCE